MQENKELHGKYIFILQALDKSFQWFKS